MTGTVEPTDEECEWHSDREEEEELAVSTPLIGSSSAPNEFCVLFIFYCDSSCCYLVCIRGYVSCK